MDDPVRDIEQVIHDLTMSTPSVQRRTIETYFTNDASFCHPFCRTGSFDGSRFLIRAIFRWYKILSPKIDLTVNSIAYDSKNLILYINISQNFKIWFVPFYNAPVTLTTVLQLIQSPSDGKYYLTSQEDLYQVNQFVKFFAPFGGFILVWLWQIFSTFICLLGAVALWPISWVEEHGFSAGGEKGNRKRVGDGAESKERSPFESVNASGSAKTNGRARAEGNMITAPAVEQR